MAIKIDKWTRDRDALVRLSRDEPGMTFREAAARLKTSMKRVNELAEDACAQGVAICINVGIQTQRGWAIHPKADHSLSVDPDASGFHRTERAA